MGMVTTVPAVKAALRAALVSRAGLSGVAVDYGEPGDGARREAVLLSTAIDTATRTQLVMRKGRDEEDYQLRVHVWSAKASTPEATEARAEAIAGEVAAVVLEAGTPPLGLAEVSWLRVGGSELVTETAGELPVTRLTVLLNVKSRLVP